jgi:uncharacterized protein DUF998
VATRRDRLTTALLACGVVGGPLFIAVFLVAGALRPGYDTTQVPVSLLTLGPGGRVQVANFLAFGMLTIAFAVGLHRAGRYRAGVVLLLLVGLGLLGSGLARPDPGAGYPPGATATESWHGAVHGWCAILFVGGLAAASLVLARRGGRRWRGYSILTGTLVIASFLASLAVGPQAANLAAADGGLLERVAGILGPLWTCVLAVRILRTDQSRMPGETR